jgi:hypothetical protein
MDTPNGPSCCNSPQAIDREVRRLFDHDVTNADLNLAYRLTDALPNALREQVAGIHD